MEHDMLTHPENCNCEGWKAMTPEVPDAEIVEVAEPTLAEVEIPPCPERYAVLYPFRFGTNDPVAWAGFTAKSVAEAIDVLSKMAHVTGSHGDLQFYRLGPPKPRMTEEEVNRLATELLSEAGWMDKNLPDPAMFEALIAFARRLGVLEQPS